MAGVLEHTIREPSVASAKQYRDRVHRLAVLYVGLFCFSLVGIAIITWKAQFYVDLAQRSNVETLTLFFFVVFFGYLVILSSPGAFGALLMFWLSFGPRSGQRRKMDLLSRYPPRPNSVATNLLLERDGETCSAFSIPIADVDGSMGTIRVDGARITHEPTSKDGSSALLSYFVAQVNDLLERHSQLPNLQIVQWTTISDEAAAEYFASVDFARNLQRALNAEQLWPRRTITRQDCAELEHRLSTICPALRDESFLPHWEFQGEHRIPLVPEPLGLLSLNRTERRVDPLSSMGCAVAIVFAVIVVLALFIAFPPWVPGA